MAIVSRWTILGSLGPLFKSIQFAANCFILWIDSPHEFSNSMQIIYGLMQWSPVCCPHVPWCLPRFSVPAEEVIMNNNVTKKWVRLIGWCPPLSHKLTNVPVGTKRFGTPGLMYDLIILIIIIIIISLSSCIISLQYSSFQVYEEDGSSSCNRSCRSHGSAKTC